MKNIIVLGCTGSIGQSTLDIVRAHKDKLSIKGLQAHSNAKDLHALKEEFSCPTCLSSKEGELGIKKLLFETEADLVVNGIVGASGLKPSIWSLESKKDLALANKETMVLAGGLIKELASKNSCKLLPVDSEHSAIFQLLENRPLEQVDELIITASGGPFRNTPLNDFKNINLQMALAHPTWSMGPKISIDSATMANKGLEVIEAQQLFDFEMDKIKVLIHPQSYVHSLIRTKDQALYAQISAPDMKLPIQDAIFYPTMHSVPWTYLDLAGKTLEFFEPDLDKFPMLAHAFSCGKKKGAYPIAFNGANEIAVEAFLKEKIHFTQIARVTEEVLQQDWARSLNSFEQVLTEDQRARTLAKQFVESIQC